jgi:multidrug efflux pump subunit AcrB
MIRFLINRPIGVLVSTLVILLLGILSLRNLPVSLLPNIDVPTVLIKFSYRNRNAESLERDVAKPIREALLSMNNLENIESVALNHVGQIKLTFEYGSRMDLAVLEVNERLDRVLTSLPPTIDRPYVTRINTSDIPIVRIQVVPRRDSQLSEVASLTDHILRRRLEQLSGVSLVDINGLEEESISITLDKNKLAVSRLTENEVIEAIVASNSDFGDFLVKDRDRQYFVKIESRITSIQDIQNLPLKMKDGSLFKLSNFAVVQKQLDPPQGIHLYNGRKSLVITVHKQSSARMHELRENLEKLIEVFRKDYPGVEFFLTQDQTFLLDISIDNLYQDMVYGGILCALLLFLFLGNYASPTLMMISIPASIVVTFLLFYFFDISLNIISLSGLALGIGMVIDNSIVVLDSIHRKRRSGASVDSACVEGVRDVFLPVLTQVLTTVAVYFPLIYLSGIAGVLIRDQAIALTASLAVSLIIALILNPVLYKLFAKSFDSRPEHTKVYEWVHNKYHTLISFAFKKKKWILTVTVLFMICGGVFVFFIPLSGIPKMRSNETFLTIDWNESITLSENSERISDLIERQKASYIKSWESDIGISSFLLQPEINSSSKATVFIVGRNNEVRDSLNHDLSLRLLTNYPLATYEISDAQNAFTQMFPRKEQTMEIKFFETSNSQKLTIEKIKQITSLNERNFSAGPGLVKENAIELHIDEIKLRLHGIQYHDFVSALQNVMNDADLPTQISSDRTRIILKRSEEEFYKALDQWYQNSSGQRFPFSAFITESWTQVPKAITANLNGVYQSVHLNSKDADFRITEDEIKQRALNNNFLVEFSGSFFANRKLLYELTTIFFISVGLLYLILAFQFENLLQPLIAMSAMPIGVAAGLFSLYLTNSELDLMAGIGFIVVLGIIVDDPILKIEMINRIKKRIIDNKASSGPSQNLEMIIHEAGSLCLKPLLLTSLTTTFALMPILFMPGLGSDLQKPMIVVIIGGLTIGILFTVVFIPLTYWYFYREKVSRKVVS